MSFSSEGQTRLLSRVRAAVERGERVAETDIAALFEVTDTNALAGIARIPRDRRFGRSAYHTDVVRVEYGGESAEELAARIGETTSQVALVPVGPAIRPLALREAAQALARTYDVVILTNAARVDRAARTLGVEHLHVLHQLRTGAPVVVAPDGAELFDGAIRARWAGSAVAADTWLSVHRAAHELGIPTIAAMTYLTEEAPAAYAAHLETLRTMQDATSGFTGFVAMATHNRDRDASYRAVPSAHQSLRALAIARIALDTIEHIAVAPALVTAEVAYISLSYGVDTIDTTVTSSSVGLVESSGARALELPVVDAAAASGSASATRFERELVESRLVEARYVPVRLDAALRERTERVGAR
jgi:hypothetical protein